MDGLIHNVRAHRGDAGLNAWISAADAFLRLLGRVRACDKPSYLSDNGAVFRIVRAAVSSPWRPSDNECYTPGTLGTPDIVIPGIPAMGDSPGTPTTVIPGIPPTPPMPYPCP